MRQGQAIPKTNIVDLVNLLFLNSSKDVTGKEIFLQTLQEMNVPKQYIRNKYLETVKKEPLQQEPPKKKKKSKNVKLVWANYK